MNREKKEKNRATSEAIEILTANLKANMGKSKHEAKRQAREAGLPANRVCGIRSPKTYYVYKRDVMQFIERVFSKSLKLKHFSDYECLVTPYLESLVFAHYAGNGYSACNIGRIASALGAAFSRSKNSFGVILPKRKSSKYINSRNDVKSDARFKNLKKYGNAFNMAIATGARKGGLIKLTVDDIRKDKFGGYEVRLDEKGGKIRWAKVLPDYEEIVLRTFANPTGPLSKNGIRKLFYRGDLPSGLHEWRSAYCMNLYLYYQDLIIRKIIKKPINENRKSDFYYMKGIRKGEVLDRWILIKISFHTGHGPSRTSLIACNYIRAGFGLHTKHLQY